MDVVSTKIDKEYSKFKIRQLVVRAPRSDKTLEYHIIERQDSVQVIAVTKDGKLVLVEQERQATQESSLEFVAGLMDAGESPRETATRELEEETAYRAAEMTEIGWYYTDPAILTNKVTVFLAEGCERSGEKNEDEGEDVKVRVYDVDEMEALIASTKITHALTVSAWYLYQSRVQRSRSRT